MTSSQRRRPVWARARKKLRSLYTSASFSATIRRSQNSPSDRRARCPNMTNDLVPKFWGFCHTLRDYGDYIEQITYLLFLKMADERRIALSRIRASLPEGGERVIDCSWPGLSRRAGSDLIDHYKAVLVALGQQPGLLSDIFKEAASRFNTADNLKQLI